MSFSFAFKINVRVPKKAVQSSGTKIFSCWASNVSFLPSHWAWDQASCLPTKSLKDQTETCPGQAKFGASWNSSFFRASNVNVTGLHILYIHVHVNNVLVVLLFTWFKLLFSPLHAMWHGKL